MNPGYCQLCEYEGWKYIYRCDSCGFTTCNWYYSFHGWDRGDNPWANFDFRKARYDDDTDDEVSNESSGTNFDFRKARYDDDTDDEVSNESFGTDSSFQSQDAPHEQPTQ